MITVTKHEAREWSRMATAAYAEGRNEIGHRYSVAAALDGGEAISEAEYDALQEGYRAWLLYGFSDPDDVTEEEGPEEDPREWGDDDGAQYADPRDDFDDWK